MAAADYRMMTDATGQDLVAALQNLAPLQVAPLVVSIPTGQWSGSGNDYYITVNASNVTANSIVVPIYDADSRSRLKGPVWCVPAAGSFTIHTSAIPTNTVTILVQIPGTMGEAQYQVLADVYSKSQAVAKADIVNNLTSTATDKPLSAAQGKALKDLIAQSTAITTVDIAGRTDGSGNITPSGITNDKLLHAVPVRYDTNYHGSFYTCIIGSTQGNPSVTLLHCINTDGTALANTDVKIRLFKIGA